MTAESTGKAVKATQDYYDSGDADNFYYHVWGGEDLHIGIYRDTAESIREASRRTVDTMAARLQHLPPGTRLLDLGAGYGGSARRVVNSLRFHVTCLNLSPVQNERNRSLVREAGLEGKIEVVDGNFEHLPFPDGAFGAIWSQDSFLHSSRRLEVLREADRVLRPGGDIVFTDPMRMKDADIEALQPVLDRLQLEDLGTLEGYTEGAEALGWQVISFTALPEQLATHYSRVLAELKEREDELRNICSQAYRQRMQEGLRHWIDAAEKGLLNWGILHCRKA